MIVYNAYFREKVTRKFIEESDWHPCHGKDYYRPLSISIVQFYHKCERDGYDWMRWKEIRTELPSLEEMMECLEEWGYRFRTINGITDFAIPPTFELVRAEEPIVRISTKNLIRSEMDRHPVLNGMLYDKELQKRNALSALRLIEQGWKVGEAIRECHTSYSSICQYGYKGTGRQMPRKTIRKVEECIKRVEAGEKLKSVLKEMKLGAWSYYRYKNFFPNQQEVSSSVLVF